MRILFNICCFMLVSASAWGEPVQIDSLRELSMQLERLHEKIDMARQNDDQVGEPELVIQTVSVNRRIVALLEKDPTKRELLIEYVIELLAGLECELEYYVVEREDLSKAVSVGREALALSTKIFGETHWRTKLPRTELEELIVVSAFPVEKLSRLRACSALEFTAETYRRARVWEQALATYEECLRNTQSLLGGSNTRALKLLEKLGDLHRELHQYAESEGCLRQSIAMSKELFGEQHPTTAANMLQLGDLLSWLARYSEAETILLNALALRIELLGELNLETAEAYVSLGNLYRETGELHKAEPLIRKAWEIRKQIVGDNDLLVGHSLKDMGTVLLDLGDFEKAEIYFIEAAQIDSGQLAIDDPSHVWNLDNLASVYRLKGQLGLARKTLDEAWSRHVRLSSDDDWGAAHLLFALANLDFLEGDFEQARTRLEKVLEIDIQLFGRQDWDTAATLGSLAYVYFETGEYDQALQAYRECLNTQILVLGENHPQTAASQNELAMRLLELDDAREATPLLRSALTTYRTWLDEIAGVQTEKQQLQLSQQLRGVLDNWITAVPDSSVYTDVLRWKGSVYNRQSHIRAVQHTPALKSLVDELRSCSQQLAKVALEVVPADQLESRATERKLLQDQHDELERRLTTKSLIYRQARELSQLNPEKLQAAIPDRTALIDMLEYRAFRSAPGETRAGEPPHGHWQREVVAFVVRPNRPIERIELGPAAAIDAQVDKYRQHLQDPAGVAAMLTASAQDLRRLVWEPLEPHLDGIDTVLVSPDGSLGKLPFAALPGKQAETYLLEDVAIVVIPVPQALVTWGKDKDDSANKASGEPNELKGPLKNNLLILGGIDYDAMINQSVSKADLDHGKPRRFRSGAEDKSWQRLPGSAAEAVYITDTFERFHQQHGNVEFLRDHFATEGKVRELASCFRFLHFATHGFFARPEVHSLFEQQPESNHRSLPGLEPYSERGVDPGLLSGIVLAGVNQPSPDDQHDGNLTALEVASMDLSKVELVMLSACETGVGRIAGGEGLLGLQRAFQLAGAKTVVASLWKIDDAATRDLMGKFYDQYWNSDANLDPEAELPSTIECLRRAQLSILNGSIDRGRLGSKKSTVERPRTPPFYWAAFVMTGDWL